MLMSEAVNVPSLTMMISTGSEESHAWDARTHAHTYTHTHTHTYTGSSTLKCAKSLTALQTKSTGGFLPRSEHGDFQRILKGKTYRLIRTIQSDREYVLPYGVSQTYDVQGKKKLITHTPTRVRTHTG